MSLAHFFFHRVRSSGRLGHFLIMLSLAAAFNFLEVFFHRMRAGSRTVGDLTLTSCHFVPPMSFFPRFWIAVALLIAAVGVFRQSFPRSLMPVVGLTWAVAAYVYWWLDSYREFRNLSEIGFDFLNHIELKHAAYLYEGTWTDVSIAATAMVCLVLVLERFFDQRN